VGATAKRFNPIVSIFSGGRRQRRFGSSVMRMRFLTSFTRADVPEIIEIDDRGAQASDPETSGSRQLTGDRALAGMVMTNGRPGG
jgi:hypothetical protein